MAKVASPTPRDPQCKVARFHSHGAAIDADDAMKMGLTVEKLEPKEELWQAIWRLYTEYHLSLQQGSLRYVFEGRQASIIW